MLSFIYNSGGAAVKDGQEIHKQFLYYTLYLTLMIIGTLPLLTRWQREGLVFRRRSRTSVRCYSSAP